MTALVASEPLRDVLRGEGRLPVERAVRVVEQVLGALAAAHERGIVHGDIKPENVLISGGSDAQVLGFGVASLSSANALDQLNGLTGASTYMAPEQILGEAGGPESDLYAAGVLLYELLAGVPPFRAESPAAMVYYQLNEAPAPPSAHSPGVQDLDDLVLRLLDKLPAERGGSAAAVLEELRGIRRRRENTSLPGVAPGEPAEEPGARISGPRFVGRQAELDALTAPLASLDRGGKAILIAGEAGAGKARLVAELAARARQVGVRPIFGTCPFERGLGGLMPIFDAIGNLFTQEEDSLSDEERQSLRRILEAQSPELGELASTSSTTVQVGAGFASAFGTEESPDAARQQLFDAVVDLLAAAAAMKPMVLVLRDLHWADASALALVQYLAHRVTELPLLLIGTYRPEELAATDTGHDLAGVLEQLGAAGRLEVLSLSRLSQSELLELSRSLYPEADFGEDFGEYLHDQSQGNPFIALEVIKVLGDRGVLHREDGLWRLSSEFAESVIPDRVNTLVMQRIETLDTDQTELLQLAAVLGDRFASTTLEASLGLPRLDLLRTLLSLERDHRLLISDQGNYQFSHTKIREVLYDQLPWELRREYHRIAAATLCDDGHASGETDVADLARHLFHGEEWGRAIPVLQRAGNQAYSVFAWRAAATLYEQLVVAADHQSTTSDAVFHALRCGGRCLAHLGAVEGAGECFRTMRQRAAETGRAVDEAEALYHLGWLARRQRRFEPAVESYEAANLLALEHRDADLDKTRARVLTSWGAVDFERGAYDTAEARWRQALELVQAEGGSEAANALNNLAVLATVRGDLDGAWSEYERVLSLDAGDPSAQTVMTLHNMGMVRSHQGRWSEAMELYDRSLALCRERRLRTHEPAIELNRGEVLLEQGEMGAARQSLSHTVRAFRRQDDPIGLADALRLYGRLCRRERDWDEGRSYLERSVELNRDVGTSVNLGEALYELGALQWESGQAEAAVPVLREAEDIFSQAAASVDLERVRELLRQIDEG